MLLPNKPPAALATIAPITTTATAAPMPTPMAILRPLTNLAFDLRDIAVSDGTCLFSLEIGQGKR